MTNVQCLEGFLVQSDGARQAFRFTERIPVLKKVLALGQETAQRTQVWFQCFSEAKDLPEAMDLLCPQGLPIERHGAGPIFGEHLTHKTVFLNHQWRVDEEGKVQISWLKRSREEKQLLLAHIWEALHSPYVRGAYVNADRLVVFTGQERGEWLDFLKREGVRVRGSKKLNKRVKRACKDFRFRATFEPGSVNIRIEDLAHIPNQRTDGTAGITWEMVERIIAATPEDRENPQRRAQLLERVKDCRRYSFTLFLPEGFVKGEFMVVDSLPDGADILLARHMVKKEITGCQVIGIGLDPKVAKPSVRTNSQTMINLRAFFTAQRVCNWVDKYNINPMLLDLQEDRMLESLEEILRAQEDEEEQGFMVQERWKAFTYAQMGLSLRHSPALLKSVMKALLGKLAITYKRFDPKTRKTFTQKTDKIRVVVPNARTCSIETETMCQFLGLDVVVPRGEFRYLAEFNVVVVNDQDYDDFIRVNTGGSDLDDEVSLFYFNHQGSIYALMVRYPNDIGEYVVLKAPAGDKGPGARRVTFDPAGHLVKGRVYADHPDFTFDPAGLPKTTAKALQDGSLKFLGLAEGPEEVEQDYTPEFVFGLVERALFGSSPGMAVNIKMAANYVKKGQMAELLCSMEEIIDTCTMGTNTQSVRQINDYFENLYLAMKSLERARIDECMAYRFANHRLGQLPTEKGFLSQILEHIQKATQRAEDWVKKHIPVEVALQLFPPAELKLGHQIVQGKSIRLYWSLMEQQRRGQKTFDQIIAEMAAHFQSVYGGKTEHAVKHFAYLLLSGKHSDWLLQTKEFWPTYQKILSTAIPEAPAPAVTYEGSLV